MSMTIGMQNIVDDIRDSRTYRVNEIQDIKSSVKKSIAEFGVIRKHDASEMSRNLHRMVKSIEMDSNEMLNHYHANRIVMARETRDVLDEFTKKLRRDVTEIRLDAHNTVHGFADERVSRGIELSRMLKDYNDRIAPEVKLLKDQFKQERDVVKRELEETHLIWMNYLRMNKAKKKKIEKYEEVYPKNKNSEDIIDNNNDDNQIDSISSIPNENINNVHIGDTSEDISEENVGDLDDEDLNSPYYNELKEKILDEIKNSPSGISLTKAKKIIGVDKRKIYRAINELLNNGIIQKNGSNYIFYEPSV